MSNLEILNPKTLHLPPSSKLNKVRAELFSFEKNRKQKPKSRTDDEEMQITPKNQGDNGKRSIFEGLKFAVDFSTATSFKEKRELKGLIIGEGGIVSHVINKQQAVQSFKSKTAQKCDIPVIGRNFIDNCIEEERLLSVENYLLIGENKSKKLANGRVSTKELENAQKSDKKTPIYDLSKIPVYENCDSLNEFSQNFQIAKGCLLYNLASSTKRFFKCRTSGETLFVYSIEYDKFSHPPHSCLPTQTLVHPDIGSKRFRQQQIEWLGKGEEIDEQVSQLVRHIWQEVSGRAETILSQPIESIKLEKVIAAEAILLKIKESLADSAKSSLVAELVNEFSNTLPLADREYQDLATNKRKLAKCFDLCQLIKDMLNVNEATNWSRRNSSLAMYKALNCHLQHIPTHQSEIKQFYENVPELTVHNVYSFYRGQDEGQFQHEIGNVRRLFHSSSVYNFLGIMSRGLLPPKTVVEDYGVDLTEKDGLLGSGIYFGDNIRTSIKYSKA
ncbi:DgyrCDS14594, partial [Dimorphilus gyrociliatus]